MLSGARSGEGAGGGGGEVDEVGKGEDVRSFVGGGEGYRVGKEEETRSGTGGIALRDLEQKL